MSSTETAVRLAEMREENRRQRFPLGERLDIRTVYRPEHPEWRLTTPRLKQYLWSRGISPLSY